MKFIPSKVIKIGRLSVSLSKRDIVFLWSGKERILVKTLRTSPRKLLLRTSVCLSVLCAALFFSLSVFHDDSRSDISPESDDIMKDKLLMSEKTDYTSPDKREKLIVREHIVKKGETLSHIAQQYGVSIDTICGSSNLKSYHLINVGQVLRIPNKEGILHKMDKGKSLVDIAKKYKVSLEKIVTQNDLKNPDFIAPGRMIFVPDAKPQNIFDGFLWPVRSRVITCGYGWRRNPFTRANMEFHSGMDIRANYEWVKASKYGKVTFSGWLGGYGNAVIIAHPDGYKTLYAHLSRSIVRPGQYVRQGQTIARSGNTGRSTGPHLHFEVITHGKKVNPYSYLKNSRYR